ncbi:ABC transporter permease, partial [Oenococcus oeni]
GLYGMTATMCWLFAIETNLLALVFAGLAFLMAQIFDNSRNANAVSFLFLGIAYLSRMITDISKASLTWLSPIGWVELGKIGYGNDLKVVWLMLLSILILLFLAIIFALKRDINSGFLHIRSGRKNASPLLRGPISLGIRLERNLGIVWIIAIASLGIMYASIFSDVSDILKSNPNVAQVLGTNQLSQLGNKIVLQFISMISIFMLVLSTVAGLQMIFRLKKDIDNGLEEMIASKPISRFRLLTSYLLPAIIVTICSFGSSIYSMMLLGNLELKVPIESIKFNTLFFGSLPSAMLFLSLAVFLINCFPKIYSILYVYAGLSFVVLYFKNMLKLPIWVTRITPFGWIKDLPLKDINWEIWYFEVLLVLIFTFIGYFEFQRRDLS